MTPCDNICFDEIFCLSIFSGRAKEYSSVNLSSRNAINCRRNAAFIRGNLHSVSFFFIKSV